MARFAVTSSGEKKFQVLRDWIRVGPEYSSEANAHKMKNELEADELQFARSDKVLRRVEVVNT